MEVVELLCSALNIRVWILLRDFWEKHQRCFFVRRQFATSEEDDKIAGNDQNLCKERILKCKEKGSQKPRYLQIANAIGRYSQRTKQIATPVHKLTLFLEICHILHTLSKVWAIASGRICCRASLSIRAAQATTLPWLVWQKEVQSGKLRNQWQA